MNHALQFLARRPVLITIFVCVIMYLLTGLTSTTRFFDGYTFVTLFQNNFMLGMIAVGMTFVILTGGIDLSVGSVIGWSTLVTAFLIRPAHGSDSFFIGWNPYAAMAVVIAIATLGGIIIGIMVHYLEIPPFLITLAFLFLYRGWALVITTEEVGKPALNIGTDPENIIIDPRVDALSNPTFNMPGIDGHPPIYLWTLAMLAVFAIGSWLGRYTGFGRSLYAIGGSENSATLMGLPVARSKVIVYGLSGFCAALAGVATFAKFTAGAALKGREAELDAIAVTVIGGTLLSGGVGGIPSTLIGLLTYAIIQAAMSRHSFPTGMDRIVIGAILLAFILLQKLLQMKQRTT